MIFFKFQESNDESADRSAETAVKNLTNQLRNGLKSYKIMEYCYEDIPFMQ